MTQGESRGVRKKIAFHRHDAMQVYTEARVTDHSIAEGSGVRMIATVVAEERPLVGRQGWNFALCAKRMSPLWRMSVVPMRIVSRSHRTASLSAIAIMAGGPQIPPLLWWQMITLSRS